MPRLQRRSVSTPDEVRRFATGRIDLVNLDETTIGHVVFEPGWRWSKDIAPVAGTTSCQNRHIGYVITGRLHVVMADGTDLEIGAGDAYEIPPGHDAWVVGDEAWDTVEFASSRTFGMDPGAADERILATILFTDIVASTNEVTRLGDRRWSETLDRYDASVRRQLTRFRGREIKTTGDGTLATFDGPARAIQCATAIRDGVRALGIHIRAGIHTGEVTQRGQDIAGVAVVAGQRVSALAQADEVLVSRTVVDLVAGSGLAFAERGEHDLKGLPGRWLLFSVADA